MGKRLTENLSSLYIGAANSLKPKRARRNTIPNRANSTNTISNVI